MKSYKIISGLPLARFIFLDIPRWTQKISARIHAQYPHAKVISVLWRYWLQVMLLHYSTCLQIHHQERLMGHQSAIWAWINKLKKPTLKQYVSFPYSVLPFQEKQNMWCVSNYTVLCLEDQREIVKEDHTV